MPSRRHIWVLSVLGTLLALAVVGRVLSQDPDPAHQRQQSDRLMRDGNFKEAYEGFRRLCLRDDNEPGKVAADLQAAINCLMQLGRVNEVDELLEATIAKHSDNWWLLQGAAQNYQQHIPHYGYVIAGKFERGDHRGGGRVVNTMERDRVRALQLLVAAMPLVNEQANAEEQGYFYFRFAQALEGGRGFNESWRLQYLSDLTQLPDYEDGYPYYRDFSGAPVEADGTPVYHRIPDGWENASSDGQRWRWALAEAEERHPKLKNTLRIHFAEFLRSQFGVQTMQQFGFFFPRQPEESEGDESGTYALHTLEETETIARLATGIKRFNLPDEFNHIRVLQSISQDPETGRADEALYHLAEIFENRRQYPKAVQIWQESIRRFGHPQEKQQRIRQISGNWGQFEPVMTQPAGQGATVEYRFRNGNQVQFEAHEIDIPLLLTELKAHIKGDPRRLDWNKINLANIGWRIVTNSEERLLKRKVADWELDLQPAPDHFDRRITVTTPLQKAGAYLVKASMSDGNMSRIVLWISDTAIVKKQLSDENLYFVADSVTGKPVPGADVEFFGYHQQPLDRGGFTIQTNNFAERTDANGMIRVTVKQTSPEKQWLVIARSKERLAFLGFHGVWTGQYHDAQYNATRGYVITDRPVYRPGQTVRYKVWFRHAQYDSESIGDFANQALRVNMQDPLGEQIHGVTLTADRFGGVEGSYELPNDAKLGMYAINSPNGAALSFRVEEYKKPEFEVLIEAPEKPVMLGEEVTATIKAQYYFGSPVTNATVKYKIVRNNHSADWYPIAPWDWFYGRGYWWFAYDYPWYPGWENWVGCMRPIGWWWPHFHQQPPEVVAEQEVELGPDGTLSVNIDTAVAKAVHGDRDHEYTITAEVRDQSRRTIVGQGQVLVARKPFKVYTWVDRGYYRVGDTVEAQFLAQTLDQRPVQGQGHVQLLKITYDDKRQPIETEVADWDIETGEDGQSQLKLEASAHGQYRLSCTITDAQGHQIEGGYLFTVMGEGFDGSEYRFNALELIPDKRDYAPGETVKLQINTDRPGSTVLLFVRPTDGIYLPPQLIAMEGKSTVVDIGIVKRDMPNIFVEALTLSDSQVHTQVKELVIPPENRVLNVEVLPSRDEYKPGEKAKVRLRLTDWSGENFVGTMTATIYDKAVEYISGGSNVDDIREFFWKWRRSHYPQELTSLQMYSGHIQAPHETPMQPIGAFGATVADELDDMAANRLGKRMQGGLGLSNGRMMMMAEGAPGGGFGGGGLPMAPGIAGPMAANQQFSATALRADGQAATGYADAAPEMVQPTVRTNFADTALWVGTLDTDDEGVAELELDMPENLTTWKIRVWGLGHGTRVGEASKEVVTRKNLILRMQRPRFAVQKDEVVLSANVHNYLTTDKMVEVSLELDGDELQPLGDLTSTVAVSAGGEARVDWRVRVVREGVATVRMKALTDEESDAAQMTIPCHVHGLLKTESWAGTVHPEANSSLIDFRVPEERRVDQSRLEVRYSPTLAGAMVDALPYLLDYPYGCTEQTLNRFLPAVVTQKMLQDMNLNLAEIREKRSNLNAQEIGDDRQRAAGWQRNQTEPVFDQQEMEQIVKAGVTRLTNMQNPDGGWGWFSGWNAHSGAHTTAVVVRGLQVAQQNDVAIVPDVIDRGLQWLEQYQAEQVQKLKNADGMIQPYKLNADNLDALVYHVLGEADRQHAEMRDFLYRDRNHLSLYGKSLYALALHKQQHEDKLAMLRRNIDQFLVEDLENETAYLRMPADSYWWYWYGDEIETQAAYLKLLSRMDPKNPTAGRLVKYLLNNRKHATYWNSTRDTAWCVEAFGDYIRASGEMQPDMVVEVWLDGKMHKEVTINSSNLFSFDNKLVIEGEALSAGEHRVELRRRGQGPVYFNVYVTNFTLEDFITKAGLEVRVERKYYKLERDDKDVPVSGDRGQAVNQRVERYRRVPLENLSQVTSGDLLEIELEIESKNDYEYLMFEDWKAAGLEPVQVQSGYTANDLNAYMELRDDRVVFFVQRLARGNHSVSYRMRAEIPGQFSALPTQASAMYAPELRGNSDEMKLRIGDLAK